MFWYWDPTYYLVLPGGGDDLPCGSFDLGAAAAAPACTEWSAQKKIKAKAYP